jgi:hypothetical protein
MVKCHVRTFRQDLSVMRDKSQISARQVPSVTRDRRIDWNPTVSLYSCQPAIDKAKHLFLSTEAHALSARISGPGLSAPMQRG